MRAVHGISLSLIASTLLAPAVVRAQSDSVTKRDSVGKLDSVTKLDPVVVVTRGQGRSVLSAPFALSVSQPDSTRPAQRHSAIDESLAMIPGLLAISRNNPAQDPRLSIRGFGARSAFGVRGVRVLRDGMPLTLPDGQTPLDYVSLESVGRIEVMRGAASALYGNASGGVIDLQSAAPSSAPIAAKISQWLGGNGFARTALSAGGSSGGGYYQGDASLARSDGTRVHSRQRATTGFARAGVSLGETQLAVSVLALDNPLAENPGPLTLEEMRADPTMADALSLRRHARKAARQIQVGLSATAPVGGGDFSASVFEGARSLDNPLTFAVVEIGRHTYGALARLSQNVRLLGAQNQFSAGTDLQYQNDLRRNFATCADSVPLKNPTASCPILGTARGVVTLDQRELVSSAGAYISDDLSVGSRLGVTGGIRADNVRFEVRDRLVTASNPDDSGNRGMGAVTPVIGAVMRIAPAHSVYANIAGAFETPTATELGNHPDGSAGINQDLSAQRSSTAELGVKGFFGGVASYDIAGYSTRVRDELVPFEIPGSNGRRYFRNAGRTNRRGVEAGGQVSLGMFSVMAAYTFSAFRFGEYRSGASVYDGNVIPGVPRNRWQAAARASRGSIFVILEGEGAGSVFLDDANTSRGPGYTEANLRLGTEVGPRSSRLAISAGIQNMFDRHYASSVAVNAARGKYFEPAVTRSYFVGFSILAARPRS